MTCSLCGREREGDFQPHWIGCQRLEERDLTDEEAVKRGLLTPEETPKEEPLKVEELKEGSMTTVPVEETGHTEGTMSVDPDEGGDDNLSNCEYPDCTNPKYSDHPRVKYCEEHRDPKNRKE